MDLKYTIGIPTTKNEKGIILKMLSSLKKDLNFSNIKNFETIICLNNYDTETEQELLSLIKSDHSLNIRLIKSKPGLIPAQRKLIKSSKSSSDFIIFYNSDIAIKKGSTKNFIKVMAENPSVIVGTGNQEACKDKGFWYNTYNIVGLIPKLMSKRKYIIGRDFAIRKDKYFVPYPIIIDDTFISSYITYYYGKKSIKVVPRACARYFGPATLRDYYQKIRRLRLQKELIFRMYPEFIQLESYFKKKWVKEEIKNLTILQKVQLFLQKRITWVCQKTAKLSKKSHWVTLNSTKTNNVFN